jgi:predicted Zn-dependent peptidase/outer membrane protein OmpA-like peptidoglycan-associated protein
MTCIATLACLLSSHLYAQQGTWESHTLANGLQVNYCQDSTRQLLHLGLTLKGGASLDAADQKGLSKMYEHLFFQYLPDGQPASKAADAGIFLSHKTLLESQFYGMSIPPAQLPAALHLLSSGLAATAWSDSTIDLARQAIVGELQLLDDAPEHQLATELATNLWETFASNKHTTERYADILNLNSQRIFAAISPYLHPANCQLNATGPVPATTFWDAAAASLGSWTPETAAATPPKITFPQLNKSIYFQSINEFAAQPLIMMAWPVPMHDAPDRLTRDALHFCALLRLQQDQMYQHLIDSNLAVTYTWSWAGGINPGQLLLYVIPEKDRFAECLHAIQTEVAQLGKEKRFTPAAVTSATRLLQLQAAKADDQSIPRILEKGQSWLLAPDNHPALTPLNASSMQAFALAYLSDKPHVAGLLSNSALLASSDAAARFEPSVATTNAVSTADSKPNTAPTSIDPALLRSMRLHFLNDQLTVDAAAAPTLQAIATMLRDQPQKRIYLNSFSEGLGDGVKNYQLSVARAKAIRAWLTDEMHLPAQQIVIRAYGEAFPEFADDNDVRNRRISFEYAPADAQDNVY